MNQGKILLVDDEPDIVKGFTRALRREGYIVDLAYSGEEGWQKYQERYYDVVIVDWKMGKMTGMQLLQKIGEMHPRANKVIMITAFGDEETAIKAHHHHAFDYIKKPVEPSDLVATVKEAIRRQDGIVAALEDWVEANLEVSSEPFMATLSGSEENQVWSAKDILEEIKANTERGREEYRNLVQLTIDLLTRGRIQ
jgi:DNA-binding response OmpR family regulator